MAELPDVLAAVTLGPEDRLVLCFSSLSAERAQRLYEHVAAQGFGGRVLLAAGVGDVVVLRATRAEGSTVGECGDRELDPMFGNLPPQWRSCHLAHGHKGMHSDGSATWANEADNCGATLAVQVNDYPPEVLGRCVRRLGHFGRHDDGTREWSDEGSST